MGQAVDRADGADAIGTPVLVQAAVLGPADAGEGVAAVVGEVAADGQVVAAALGVAELGDAPAALELDAFEIVLEDEVDDAGHGVGAVNGRGTAGDQVNAFDQGDGDGVGVDHAGQVEGNDATAVDQNQGPVGAQAAQVDGGAATRAVVDARADGRQGDRQVLDQFLDRERLVQRDFLGTDRGDGAGCLEAGLADARTGDDDVIDGRVLAGVLGDRGEGAERHERGADENGRSLKALLGLSEGHVMLHGGCGPLFHRAHCARPYRPPLQCPCSNTNLSLL